MARSRVSRSARRAPPSPWRPSGRRCGRRRRGSHDDGQVFSTGSIMNRAGGSAHQKVVFAEPEGDASGSHHHREPDGAFVAGPRRAPAGRRRPLGTRLTDISGTVSTCRPYADKFGALEERPAKRSWWTVYSKPSPPSIRRGPSEGYNLGGVAVATRRRVPDGGRSETVGSGGIEPERRVGQPERREAWLRQELLERHAGSGLDEPTDDVVKIRRRQRIPRSLRARGRVAVSLA